MFELDIFGHFVLLWWFVHPMTVAGANTERGFGGQTQKKKNFKHIKNLKKYRDTPQILL